MFIDLFQEIEVENLFKALDLCMEYLFEAFMEYASPEMKLYYEKLTEMV